MIFSLYKPKGPTSNAVLNIIRRAAGTKKVGHAGTLDPLAEGVLVVGIGREATRMLGEVVAKEKEYKAAIRLGTVSSTDDGEGAMEPRNITRIPTLDEIKNAVHAFEGGYMQTPPIYSALKVNGKEAYKLARAGKKVALKPRKAVITEIEIIEYAWPALLLRAITGPGVYIRALARDIGEALNTGAYLEGLVRTRVGAFTLEDSVRLEDVETYIHAHQDYVKIISMEPHYICTGGCKGVSDKPGVCRAPACPKHGQPLTECACEDNKHNGAEDKEDEASSK